MRTTLPNPEWRDNYIPEPNSDTAQKRTGHGTMVNLTTDASLPLERPNGPFTDTAPPTSWAATPPSELVQAVSLVARAVQGRIAVLQAEIDQLRRALQPFKQMGQVNQDVFAAGGDDAVNELLMIARRLGGGESGQK